MADYVLQLKNINKYFGKSHVIKNEAISLPFWDHPAVARRHSSA